ncbi:hypothetical protein WMY93_006504 [Mugilogobius chulae]|uniref:Rho-GAP domain-containing protein n=1 Tax=Mugilogobius chulae TaxID=88201 RepID=A0AAW0PU91_9GOBI
MGAQGGRGLQDNSGAFKPNMAAGKDVNENTLNKRMAVLKNMLKTYLQVVCNHFLCFFKYFFSFWSLKYILSMYLIERIRSSDHSEDALCRPGPRSLVFNPDFFVEKLRHESPDVFLEVVLSNVTRLIDLPGTEFSQLLGDDSPKTPTGSNTGFFKSFNFLKRKDKSVLFGTQLNETCIAQIYQLIEYLSKNLHVEGLFRVPGNSVRQQTLRDLLSSGAEVDWSSGDFHPNDVASLLKSLLGELPEPLLTHRHFHAHLKIADITLLDEHGNKTSAPNKERQIESLQLLFLLLPPTNRALLKLLLDLLYHTAKLQDKNKMSTFNLALMFAPHVLWPKHRMGALTRPNVWPKRSEAQPHRGCLIDERQRSEGPSEELNNSMAFLIKHSQKLFRAPGYLRDYAKQHFSGTSVLQSKDDLELLSLKASPVQRKAVAQKRTAAQTLAQTQDHSSSPASQYTEDALKDLFRHVNNNMPRLCQEEETRKTVGETDWNSDLRLSSSSSRPKETPTISLLRWTHQA